MAQRDIEIGQVAKNVEAPQAEEAPWICGVCGIPRSFIKYIFLVNDCVDTPTDIIFTVKLFLEGKILWSLIMSVACVFGMLNFLSTIPFARCFKRGLPTYLNKKKGKLMNKAFKSSDGSIKQIWKDVRQDIGAIGNGGDNVVAHILQLARVNYMGMYLCCYKLGEDIPASIIRLLYAYETQSVACSDGIVACSILRILSWVGTITNMFGLFVAVLIFLYFALVIFRVSWKCLDNEYLQHLGSVFLIFGCVLIAIVCLLSATIFLLFIGVAKLNGPTFIISTEIIYICYVFMAVIAVTSLITLWFHLKP